MVQYLSDNILDLQDRVDNIVKGSLVNTLRRKDIEEVLNWLQDYVQGATGVLPDDGAATQGKQCIKQLLKTLTGLKVREKGEASVEALVELEKGVLELWVE